MKNFKPVISAILILILLTKLNAQQGNYQNYPVGEKAAGLGGAYTAVADDGTAAWYNPGGLAFLNSSSVSLSSTAYTYFEARREKHFGPHKDFLSSAFNAVPATVATNKPLLNGNLSFVFLEPKFLDFNEVENNIPDGSGKYYSYYRGLYLHQLWAGLAYGFRLNSDIGLGFSVLGTEVKLEQYEIIETPSGSPLTNIDFQHSGMSMTTYLLSFCAGLLYWYDRNWRFGGQLRTGGISLGSIFSSGGVGYKVVNDTGNPANNVYIVEKFLPTNYALPWRFAVGASYIEGNQGLLSFEIAIQTGFSYFKFIETENLDYGIEFNPVVNLNIGGEIRAGEEFLLRGGFYTDFAPEVTPSSTHRWEKADIFGVTFGLAWKSDNTSSSITLIYAGGIGTAINTEGKKIDYTLNSIYLVVAVAYHFN